MQVAWMYILKALLTCPSFYKYKDLVYRHIHKDIHNREVTFVYFGAVFFSATSKGMVMTSDMENFIMTVNLNSVLLCQRQVPRNTLQFRLYRFYQNVASRKQNHCYVIRNKNVIHFRLFSTKPLQNYVYFTNY